MTIAPASKGHIDLLNSTEEGLVSLIDVDVWPGYLVASIAVVGPKVGSAPVRLIDDLTGFRATVLLPEKLQQLSSPGYVLKVDMEIVRDEQQQGQGDEQDAS